MSNLASAPQPSRPCEATVFTQITRSALICAPTDSTRKRPTGRVISVALCLTMGALAPLTVHAASSASHQIANGQINGAGGTSASANFVVSACVGSEIAGSSASVSHRIDSGCGPTSLAIALDFPVVPPVVVPTVSGMSLALLIVMLGVVSLVRLRGLRR